MEESALSTLGYGQGRGEPRRFQLPHAVVLGCWLLAWWTGFRGIDFGWHWDERKLLAAAARAYDEKVPLPHWYNYPSLSFDVILAAMLPESVGALSAAAASGGDDGATDGTPSSLLRTRAVFMTLTLLTGLVAFGAAHAAGVGSWLAAFAAALTLSSWELGYHARWIAPDGLAMTFSALSLALLLAAQRRSAARQRWVLGAAAAAALAAGAKYPAGLSLVPVLVHATAAAWRPGLGVRGGLATLASACLRPLLLFALVFVLVTPGILFEPARFLRDILAERQHYGVAGHRGYDTLGYVDHLVLIARYLLLDAASPYPALSALVALLAGAGSLKLLSGPRLPAFTLLFLPIAIPLYLASQRVMIVRNLLTVIPFIAVLAALGLSFVVSLLPARRSSRLAVGAVAALLVIPGHYFAVTAAEAIAHRRERKELHELREFIVEHPDWNVFPSERLAAKLHVPFVAEPELDGQGWIAFSTSEISDRSLWISNRVDYRLLPNAPREVNFRYYPSWRGDERIVLAPLHAVAGSRLALSLGFSLAPRDAAIQALEAAAIRR